MGEKIIIRLKNRLSFNWTQLQQAILELLGHSGMRSYVISRFSK